MPRSALSLRVENATPDNWAPIDTVYDKVVDAIPPGRALRRYETTRAARQRLADQRRRHPEKSFPQPEPTEGEKIAMGKRDLFNEVVGTLRSHRIIETETRDGVRWIRRSKAVRNPCLVCGSEGTRSYVGTDLESREQERMVLCGSCDQIVFRGLADALRRAERTA